MSIKISLETAALIKRFYQTKDRITFDKIYNRLSKKGLKDNQIEILINKVFNQISS